MTALKAGEPTPLDIPMLHIAGKLEEQVLPMKMEIMIPLFRQIPMQVLVLSSIAPLVAQPLMQPLVMG